MARLFARLRTAIVNEDVDERVLARMLGISVCTVSAKLNGHNQWKLGEMYAILKLLRLLKEDLPLYFPENGQNEEGCSRGKTAGRGKDADTELRPTLKVIRRDAASAPR